MDDGFIATPLDTRRIDQAFPLVRALAPELTVARWRAYAAAMIGPSSGEPAERGIVTVQNERGYIHGLFAYARECSLQHGHVLAVDNFIVLDLFNPGGAATTLLRAMETLARALSCPSIQTTFPATDGGLPDYCRTMMAFFHREGHVADTPRLQKCIESANDNADAALAGVDDKG